jgi:hypothetical protein
MMARPKKTILVQELKEMVNQGILDSRDDYKENRAGMAWLIEKVLIETNNYRGFRHLVKGDMVNSAQGTTVGMHDQSLPREEWFKDTDHTRVRYL